MSAAGLSILLLVTLVGGSIYASAINPAAGAVTAVASLLLYPGIAGNIAARSRSSDAVIAVVTLVISLVFTGLVLLAIQSPWGGWPGRRVIAIAVGVCLLFTGVLFGILLATTRVARPGGAVRGVAAVVAGVVSVVVIWAPLVMFVLLMPSRTGGPPR